MLVHPSYVSLESALAHHGLIPEAVFTTTSVTTARPATYQTPLGRFDYRHIAPSLFWGYVEIPVGSGRGRQALVARPEKALLDLVYLRNGADRPAFLRELRLDRLDKLDPEKLVAYAERTGKPKLRRAARRIVEMAAEQADEWVTL